MNNQHSTPVHDMYDNGGAQVVLIQPFAIVQSPVSPEINVLDPYRLADRGSIQQEMIVPTRLSWWLSVPI